MFLTPQRPELVSRVGYLGSNQWFFAPDPSHVSGRIHAGPNADIRISDTAKISPDTVFGMPGKLIEKIVIGDGTTIYGGQIAPSQFVCGDYVTIHREVFIYGKSHCLIGHNAWFGMRCTLDCEGTYWEVGNNFGAGQDTHMWSHIAHGDVLQGCMYHDLSQGFRAGDDVWLVGRCTSAPVTHQSRSVALTESNLTKGMGENQVWGGNPAKDLTDKLGPPYGFDAYHSDSKALTTKRKKAAWKVALDEYEEEADDSLLTSVVKRFNINDRTYEKDITDPDIEKFFLYMLKKKKFKFVPVNHQRVNLND